MMDRRHADRASHWMENKGAVPAVMLVTGIAKKESWTTEPQ
jgi:hypothetical protein